MTATFWDDTLLKCLSSGQLADVTFTFPEEHGDLDSSSEGVMAHRLLLSLASPVFKVLLDSQSKFEKSGAVIEISDIPKRSFRLLIECIYAGNTAGMILNRPTSFDDLIGAFYGMKKYQLDHLRCLFVQRFQNLLAPGLSRKDHEVGISSGDFHYGLDMYLKIRHWSDEEDLKNACLWHVAKNFFAIDWSKEYVDFFQKVIYDQILDAPEKELFFVAMKVARSCRPENPNEYLRHSGILGRIRFPLMSQSDLIDHVWPTGVLTMSELHKLLQRLSGAMIDCGFSIEPRVRHPDGQRFLYVSDFDQNGIIYQLGHHAYVTKPRPEVEPAEPFLNPQEQDNEFKVTASSVHCLNHTVNRLTSRAADAKCWTKNELNSWFEFDFGETTTVMPTAYTLRHGFDKARDGIRNWVLEGSNDHDCYDILRCHSNDTNLGNAPFDTHTWALQNATGKAYRYLRLRQIGPGAAAESKFKYQFTISGVEFYGMMYQSPQLKPT